MWKDTDNRQKQDQSKAGEGANDSRRSRLLSLHTGPKVAGTSDDRAGPGLPIACRFFTGAFWAGPTKPRHQGACCGWRSFAPPCWGVLLLHLHLRPAPAPSLFPPPPVPGGALGLFFALGEFSYYFPANFPALLIFLILSLPPNLAPPSPVPFLFLFLFLSLFHSVGRRRTRKKTQRNLRLSVEPFPFLVTGFPLFCAFFVLFSLAVSQFRSLRRAFNSSTNASALEAPPCCDPRVSPCCPSLERPVLLVRQNKQTSQGLPSRNRLRRDPTNGQSPDSRPTRLSIELVPVSDASFAMAYNQYQGQQAQNPYEQYQGNPYQDAGAAENGYGSPVCVLFFIYVLCKLLAALSRRISLMCCR